MKKPTIITSRLSTTQFVEVVAADLDTTPAQAHEAVTAVFSAIARANASGHNVAITNFGTFISHRVKRAQRRNPQTGETFTAQAHLAPRFRPSPALAEAVRRRNRRFTIRKAASGASGGAR